VGGLEFHGLRGVGPSGLDVGVDGGVDDGAGARLSAREKDKLRLVEDALGLYFRHVGHFADPIHRSGIGIKINLRRDTPVGRGIPPYNHRDGHTDAEFVEPDFDEFAVSTLGGELQVYEVEFDADEQPM